MKMEISMEVKKHLTGYPSIDKPWLKYYTKDAINAQMPECTIYEYLWENNKDYPNNIALNYFDRKSPMGKYLRILTKQPRVILRSVLKAEIL